jgi:hypothetical protein
MVRTMAWPESSRLRPGAGFGSFLAGFFDSRFAVFLFPISTVYPPRSDLRGFEYASILAGQGLAFGVVRD